MKKVILFFVVVFIAVGFVSTNGFADGMPHEIINMLISIQQTLDYEIIPKLDECSPYTGVQKTGQTTSYAPGDDGDFEKGVAWPNPRFTINGDGTVTDNLTGLMWLQDANFFGSNVSWDIALSACNGLDFAEYDDWRLPNVRELHSLIDFGHVDPSLSDTAGTGKCSPGDPFYNVSFNAYWSSSYPVSNSGHAWWVHMSSGNVHGGPKNNIYYVWPVRGGE